MSDVIALLDTDYFQVGLRFGLGALALGWALALLLRKRGRHLPIAGVLISAATMATLIMLDEPVATEFGALGLILVGALVPRLARLPGWTVPLAVMPGSIWLALSTSTTELVWVRIAIAVLVPLGGYLISDFEERYENLGLGVVFYALACLGVFVAVPDTEWARVLIATAVPVTFLAWPRVVASLGTEGSYLAVAVLILVSAHGGGQRPASIVGSIACLGLLFLEPLAIYMSPSIVGITNSLRQNWAGAVIASLPQFVVVALCSRVAARFTREIPAFVVVVLVYMATLAVGFWADPGRTTTTRTV